MKRVLTSCAALAAVALAGTPQAWAADANLTSGLKLKISGFIASQVALVLSDTRSDNGGFDRDYDFQTNARLIFDVMNTTDSGLEYGGRIRFDSVNRQSGVKVTRVYTYVKGDFGTITFGDAPTVADDIGYVYVHDDLVSDMGRVLSISASCSTATSRWAAATSTRSTPPTSPA